MTVVNIHSAAYASLSAFQFLRKGSEKAPGSIFFHKSFARYYSNESI
jgi:hypothetical protein